MRLVLLVYLKSRLFPADFKKKERYLINDENKFDECVLVCVIGGSCNASLVP